MEQAAITAKREFNRYFAKLTESIKDEKAKTELRVAQDGLASIGQVLLRRV